MSSVEFYDHYATRQHAGGLNARHMAINGWLGRFGLKPGLDVLEIGCGVGTVTSLIAKRLNNEGSLTAVDLSPRSIQFAKKRVSEWSNVDLVSGDILQLDFGGTFDVMVLPDVIEHIPLEQHPHLWRNVKRWLRHDGWALIHMPDPLYLRWLQHNEPGSLQQIDQPIWTEQLAADTRHVGLRISYLETYSVWINDDYQVVVLRHA